MRDKILNHFSGDYLYFYQKYLPEIEKAGPNEFKALCPFHAETESSFNFNCQTGQFFCHGCQNGGDIFTFYGLKNKIDTRAEFSKICNGIAGDFSISKGFKPKPKIIKTYDYQNADGSLFSQVCRMEPKSFRQRRPDGNGDWIWSMKGVKPILYRLPDIADADEVLIVEGEKDADNLQDLGFTATTCPMGAGKWRDHYNEYLKGKHIVLIPDNDDPGRKHMAEIARSLDGQAASIKMLDLPEVPEKGDVTEFISIYEDKDEAAEKISLFIDRAEPYSFTDADDPEKKDECLSTGSSLTRYPCTDMGNAERLASRHGEDLRYCHPFNRWYVWDGKHWAEDDTGEIKRRCKGVIRDMYDEASRVQDDDRRKALIDYARKCESNQRVQNMLALTQSEVGIPILPDDMDTNPWLFNCQNGTIDLKTGDLQPHNREHLITKIAPYNYDPGAECPAWLDHLNKIFNDDQELIHFLQQAFGYSMSGDTSERLVFISWGGGANGKSVTHDIIARAIGDYAMRTPTETLLVKRNEGIPNDVARLMGARFVYASEAEQGKRLAESLIKDMSGGEKIAARFMRAEWFEFYPEFKIWLSTNHKPIIRGTDNAIWDRIRLIPFDVTIPPDQRIKKEIIEGMLEKEMPGILAWMVRGCLDWQKNGLKTPGAVIAATGKYRDEMDVIGEFIAECCSTGEILSATAKDLYAAYESFCEDNGDRAVSKKMFGMKLEEKGFDSFRGTRGVRTWIGLSVNTSDV